MRGPSKYNHPRRKKQFTTKSFTMVYIIHSCSNHKKSSASQQIENADDLNASLCFSEVDHTT